MTKQSSYKDPSGNTIRPLIIIIVVFCFSLLVYLISLSQITNLSPPELISNFRNSLYVPDKNQFLIGEIDGKNILALYYGLILLSVIIVSGIFLRFIYAPHSEQSISFDQTITLTCIIALLTFAGVQQIHRFDYLKHESKFVAGKTLHEKNSALAGARYQYAQASVNTLSGHHQGTLVTDLDFSKSPYMFYHRQLSYYLYPHVSLRLDNQSPKDILVLYYKESPLEHIPENYKILLSSEDNNYILAIKEKSMK